VAIGAGGYLLISYFTDRKTKDLFNAILREIRNI